MSIIIFNATSGSVIKTLTGHINCVRSAAYSPDSKYIISGSDDKSIKVWNT